MITKKYYKLIRVSHEDSAYMRLKNISNEAGIFKMVKTGNPTSPNLEYSLDGVTWTTYDFTTLPEVTVAAGANIYFRGTNANQRFNTGNWQNYVSFSFNKTCEGFGNMCSLFNPDPAVFTTITSIGTFGLGFCFANCITLTKAPSIGNVTTIGKEGLSSCFLGCTSLTEVINLENVTRVDVNGLVELFRGCTSLTTGADFKNLTTVSAYGLSSLYRDCVLIQNVTTPNIQTFSNTLDLWLEDAGTSVPSGTTKVVNVPTGATISGSTSGIPTGWTRVDY